MDKTAVATKVAENLFATEHAIDDALVATSQFLSTMIEARRELQLSPVLGEVAQARVAEAIASLTEARRAIVATHSTLKSVQGKLGVQHTAVGPESPEEPVERELPKLRLATA
jgi:hypothetical protein